MLRQHAGPRARQVAATLADRAIADDPIGMVRIGMSTFAEYFNARRRSERPSSDLGFDEPLDRKTLTLLRDRFQYEPSNTARTLVTRYFERGAAWQVFCLFALLPPTLLMLRMQWRRQPASALFIALLAGGLVFGELLCSQIISFRYLQPLPMLFMLGAAIVTERLLSRRAIAHANGAAVEQCATAAT